MNDHSLVNLLPSNQPVAVQFLPNSNAVSQIHAFCGDVDACKYDLEKTKNLELAAASKHFVNAQAITSTSLVDTNAIGKVVKYNPSHFTNGFLHMATHKVFLDNLTTSRTLC